MFLQNLIIFFFRAAPLSATSRMRSIKPTARRIGSARLKGLAMRHPQRLHIRFLGTQIWAEGILGILGAIVVISAILAAYLQS
jgi:hypothetical protein